MHTYKELWQGALDSVGKNHTVLDFEYSRFCRREAIFLDFGIPVRTLATVTQFCCGVADRAGLGSRALPCRRQHCYLHHHQSSICISTSRPASTTALYPTTSLQAVHGTLFPCIPKQELRQLCQQTPSRVRAIDFLANTRTETKTT